MNLRRAILHLLVATVAAGVLGVGQPAECRDDECGNLGCNDELPCPGANCGCVRRPGQPFGRCAPY